MTRTVLLSMPHSPHSVACRAYGPTRRQLVAACADLVRRYAASRGVSCWAVEYTLSA